MLTHKLLLKDKEEISQITNENTEIIIGQKIKPIQIVTLADLKDLMNLVSNHSIEDELLLACDGNTYLKKHINQLNPEEVTNVPIFFIKEEKNTDRYYIVPLKDILFDQSNILRNKLLAEGLTAVNLQTGTFSKSFEFPSCNNFFANDVMFLNVAFESLMWLSFQQLIRQQTIKPIEEAMYLQQLARYQVFFLEKQYQLQEIQKNLNNAVEHSPLLKNFQNEFLNTTELSKIFEENLKAEVTYIVEQAESIEKSMGGYSKVYLLALFLSPLLGAGFGLASTAIYFGLMGWEVNKGAGLSERVNHIKEGAGIIDIIPLINYLQNPIQNNLDQLNAKILTITNEMAIAKLPDKVTKTIDQPENSTTVTIEEYEPEKTQGRWWSFYNYFTPSSKIQEINSAIAKIEEPDECVALAKHVNRFFDETSDQELQRRGIKIVEVEDEVQPKLRF